MTATAYLPTKEVAKVQNFVQFTTGAGVSALNTALQTFAAAAGTILAQTDAITSGNALVIVNDNTVFSVAPNNWVGFNFGTWSQWTPAQVAGGPNSTFTQYFTS